MSLDLPEVEDEFSGSEFGKGLVVCLAKFSEHLHYHGPYNESEIRRYARGHEPIPASLEVNEQVTRRMHPEFTDEQVKAAVISDGIEMWMNGASDHMYEVDESAPKPLKELAALTLRIGHGFTGGTWTLADMDKIRELWRESCIALDERLGVESDWGSY